MLAYSKSAINFRDGSMPIPAHLSSVSGMPSFSLTAGNSSSDDGSDSEEWIHKTSSFLVDEHDRGASECQNQSTSITNGSSSSDNRSSSKSSSSGSIASLEIIPAEHNTIVEVQEQISMPWSKLFQFECFNAVQSACFNVSACSDENLVVSAPTGCGKTVIFELSILRLLSSRASPDAKVVFLAPIKALCQEKVRDWTTRFSCHGVKVVELTGDATNKDVSEVSKAQIICTTPEKWDSITRRWAEHIYLLGKVQLLLVDEAHNISVGDTRGATLEAVVCRMKTVSRSAPVIKHNLPAMNLRIIAVSATLPNLGDIGDFVQAKPENVMAFDASFRPVPLAVHVIAYSAQSSDYWFEKSLEKKVPEVVAKYSGGRPALIFCGSRKSTEATADLLGKGTKVWHRDAAVVAAAQRVTDGKLKAALLRGVGFHHANLLPAEKALVEGLFRDRALSALCCTSTLAMGVNLPAHLVIIKSTAQWQGKVQGYTQMASSSLNQMMGRAGRPGLDDNGIAVIMTDAPHEKHYLNLAHGSEVVESELHEDLVGILNAEVCNKVVESVDDADEWIKGTFLFTRLKKNPKRYGLRPQNVSLGATLADGVVTEFLTDKLRVAFQELTEAGIVEFDEDRILVSPLKPSVIMSRQMLKLETMQSILAMPLDANIDQVLKVLCSTKEVLQEVRHGQKKILKDLISDVRFNAGPKSKKIESLDKTYLLMQGLLGHLPMEDVTMEREQHMMADSALRVLNAMVDHALDVGAGRGLLSAAMLRRNLEQQLWETGVSELYQLESSGLFPALVDNLEKAGVASFTSLAEANPFMVEKHAGRRAPFGARIIGCARKVMEQALSCSVRLDADETNQIIVSVTRKHVTAAPTSSEWGGGGGGSSGADNGGNSDGLRVEYTLVAFTKQPRTLLAAGGGAKVSGVNGVHLYRKVTEPCNVVLPKAAIAAVRASTLCVSLVANFVGLDEHRSLTLPGAVGPAEHQEGVGESAPASPSSAADLGAEASGGSNDDEDDDEALLKPQRTVAPTPKARSAKSSSSTSSSSTSSSSTSKPTPSTSSSSSSSSVYQSNLTQEDARSLFLDKDPPKLPTKPSKQNGQKVDSLDRFLFTPSEESSKRSSGLTAPIVSGSLFHGDDVIEKKGVNDESKDDLWGVESRKKGGSKASSLTSPGASSLTSPSGKQPRASGYSRKTTTGSRDIRDAGAGGNVLSTLRRKAGDMNLDQNVKSFRLLPPQPPSVAATSAALSVAPTERGLVEEGNCHQSQKQNPHQFSLHKESATISDARTGRLPPGSSQPAESSFFKQQPGLISSTSTSSSSSTGARAQEDTRSTHLRDAPSMRNPPHQPQSLQLLRSELGSVQLHHQPPPYQQRTQQQQQQQKQQQFQQTQHQHQHRQPLQQINDHRTILSNRDQELQQLPRPQISSTSTSTRPPSQTSQHHQMNQQFSEEMSHQRPPRYNPLPSPPQQVKRGQYHQEPRAYQHGQQQSLSQQQHHQLQLQNSDLQAQLQRAMANQAPKRTPETLPEGNALKAPRLQAAPRGRPARDLMMVGSLPSEIPRRAVARKPPPVAPSTKIDFDVFFD